MGAVSLTSGSFWFSQQLNAELLYCWTIQSLSFGIFSSVAGKGKLLGAGGVNIGFYLYSLQKDSAVKMSRRFFESTASKARSPSFVNKPESSATFQLDPGRYLLVPTTFHPGVATDFIIRLFADTHVKLYQLE